MPRFEIGNMWSVWDTADRFIVLCSSTLKDGNAILNTTVGKELVERFPKENIPQLAGNLISARCEEFGIFGTIAEGKLGLFQDKRDYQEPTDLACISTSCMMLAWKAKENPTLQFHVEKPGQGDPYWLIKNILENLPENIVFWSKP